MIKINNAKINSDGSVSILALYQGSAASHEDYGIYKYFITNAPISVAPDSITHIDIPLVVYYRELDLAVDLLDVIIPDTEIIADTLNDVLYVYVVTNEDDLYLCSCKDKYDMTSIIPMCKIYKNLMGFVNSLNHDECNIPMNFIDQIMRYAYLMSALQSGNHYKVQLIWDTYFKNNNNINVSNGNCGCHG